MSYNDAKKKYAKIGIDTDNADFAGLDGLLPGALV